MADPFARATERLLARLGGEAFYTTRPTLRGTPCDATMFHGVAVLGEYGEVVATRSTVVLSNALTPKPGDPFVVDGKTWVLDSLESTDSYSSTFWLR